MHEDERNPSRVGGLVQIMESFSFVFIMKMMLQILRITNDSCLAKEGSKYCSSHVFGY